MSSNGLLYRSIHLCCSDRYQEKFGMKTKKNTDFHVHTKPISIKAYHIPIFKTYVNTCAYVIHVFDTHVEYI